MLLRKDDGFEYVPIVCEWGPIDHAGTCSKRVVLGKSYCIEHHPMIYQDMTSAEEEKHYNNLIRNSDNIAFGEEIYIDMEADFDDDSIDGE